MGQNVLTPVQNQPLLRFFLLAASFVVVVAGMRAASAILVPFLLAVFIAVITTPLFFFLRRWGFPSGLILAILILMVFLAGLGGAMVVRQSAAHLTRSLPGYQQRLQEESARMMAWLQEKGVNVSGETSDPIDGKALMRWTGNTLGAVGGLLSNMFLIILIAVFMLLEAAILPDKVRSLPGLSEEGWRRVQAVVMNVRQYVGLKTIMSLLTGLLVGAWLWGMSVDHFLLLGLLAFFLNYVPNIGSIVASVPGIVLTLIQYSPSKAVAVAIGYLVINIGISNVLEPRFLGRGLGLSPMFIVLSMVFWGWVLGPVGMLLAVPLTVTLKIALEGGERTRGVAVLLGAGPGKKSEPLTRTC